MIKDEKQQEALEIIENNGNLTIAASVGFGKTYLTLKYLKSKDYKILIACPISVKNTWINEIKNKDIGILDSIKFTTLKSLNKQSLDYNCLVIDECHNILESHISYLKSFSGKIIGLTGTPPKNKSDIKYRIIEKFFPIKFEYYIDEAISDKMLNDYNIYIHKLSLSDKKNFKVKTKNGYFITSELENYNYWCKKINNINSRVEEEKYRIIRMRMLMNYDTKSIYCKKLIEQIKNKCLIFCTSINQANYLSNNSYNSKDKKSETNLNNFIEGKIKKLSCVNQLNEGVNIPDLKNVIIIHTFSNEFRLVQKLGRAVRLNPNDRSNIHLICYKDTIDETWLTKALSHLNAKNVKIL